MTGIAAPPAWVRFTLAPPPGLGPKTSVDRYRVEQVSTVTGAPLGGVEVGAMLFRIETEAGPPPGSGELLGVTQHLGYQSAAERVELAPPAPPGSGAQAVIIPLSKSGAWWEMAHDQRVASFRDQAPRGHVHVGRPYANRIHRKLYHARYQPGSRWDFITYFEFLPERAAEFRALLSALRDPERNPEWAYVERESEIWLKRF
jgi:hypothetical protein